MATISEVRSLGTVVVVPNNPILEPLGAPESLKNKLGRFPEELYNTGQDSHLYKFLVALCGDAGAGSLKRDLLYPKLQEMLNSTHFSDLDLLYGNPMGLPRLSQEIYDTDPRSQALTQAEWQEIRIKDALYRERALTWMRAILNGPSIKGIQLAAEAALGIECDVFEKLVTIENTISDRPITLPDPAPQAPNSRSVFVIIPRAPAITEAEKHRVIKMVDVLRPVNTVPYVVEGNGLRNEMAVNLVEASSHFFAVQRFVTGQPGVDWPAVNLTEGLWIEADVEKEAPTFAFIDRQEAVTFLTVHGVTTSSQHQGEFAREQRELFGHLRGIESNDYQSADRSYVPATAPLQLGTPWTTGYGS